MPHYVPCVFTHSLVISGTESTDHNLANALENCILLVTGRFALRLPKERNVWVLACYGVLRRCFSHPSFSLFPRDKMRPVLTLPFARLAGLFSHRLGGVIPSDERVRLDYKQNRASGCKTLARH
jgi:hypothetical protein